MRNPPFKVTRHDDHATIEILQRCMIRYSYDGGTTWRELAPTEFEEGDTYRDSNATEARPTFYADGQMQWVDEPYPATAMAFQAWFGDGYTGERP